MRSFRFLPGVVVVLALVGCASRADDGSRGGEAPSFGSRSVSPPPDTLTPQDLEAHMEKIGPAYEALRTHLQAGEQADAAKEAQQLAEWFGNVEKFWAQHKREDAVKWASQARASASEAAGTAVVGDIAKATAAATNMGGACKQCHGTYRESDGAGGYRIKPSVLTPSTSNSQLPTPKTTTLVFNLPDLQDLTARAAIPNYQRPTQLVSAVR